MVTLVTQVPPAMGRDVSIASDNLGFSGNDELVFEAVRLFLESDAAAAAWSSLQVQGAGEASEEG